MIFTPLPLQGSYLIEMEKIRDQRGYNARAWCQGEMAEHGLATMIAQINVIQNDARGTVRGFHFQHPPMAEAKLFRVTRGSIFDVIIDLRRESPTFLQSTSVELSAGSGRLLYVPERFGQGSRRSRTTPSSPTRSRPPTRPATATASAGTTPCSRSTGLCLAG